MKKVKYAAVRIWNHSPNARQILEFFETKEECEKFLKKEKRSKEYTLEVAIHS